MEERFAMSCTILQICLNTRAEIIVLIVIIVIVVLLFLFIAFYAIPNLRKSDSTQTFGPPRGGTGCPPADVPTNVTSVPGNAINSIRISWDPVLQANTSGSTILGYNLYVSNNDGITTENRGQGSFTIPPLLTIDSWSGGDFDLGQTFFARVTTVDTCGESGMSEEITFTIT
jgi:hypothetical protein